MTAKRYTGLGFHSPSGKTMIEEYKMLMEELSRFSQVVYCYADCLERFRMDAQLEQDSRVLAATARNYGLITYSTASHWDLIKPFCLGMESGGARVNLWHHADFQEQHRLQHFWGRLVKPLTYVAVANSYGESNGGPSPLDTPYEPSVEATAGQAASAAVPVQKTVDDFLEQVNQECVESTVEPGVVVDVNLANAVYDIKMEGTQTTPVFDTDEEEAVRSGGDSDVSIECVPITSAEAAPGGDVESSPIAFSEASSPGQRGEPLEELAWPPPVLEGFPLTLLTMGKTLVSARDAEPGLLGVLSPGAAISPATTASETLTLEPIISPEDEAAMALGDAMMMDQFTKSLAGSFREGTLRCILDIAETYPDRPAGMYDVARGQCLSLSEYPRRARSFGGRTAKGKPQSFRPMDTIREIELGEDIPITHVLFLPKEENLPSAPFPCVGKSDASDEEGITKPVPGASSSSATPKS